MAISNCLFSQLLIAETDKKNQKSKQTIPSYFKAVVALAKINALQNLKMAALPFIKPNF